MSCAVSGVGFWVLEHPAAPLERHQLVVLRDGRPPDDTVVDVGLPQPGLDRVL